MGALPGQGPAGPRLRPVVQQPEQPRPGVRPLPVHRSAGRHVPSDSAVSSTLRPGVEPAAGPAAAASGSTPPQGETSPRPAPGFAPRSSARPPGPPRSGRHLHRPPPAPRGRPLGPGVVDQDPPHGLGRGGEEVGPVPAPAAVAAPGHPQRTPRGPGPSPGACASGLSLAGHPARRASSRSCVVDPRQQLRGRLRLRRHHSRRPRPQPIGRGTALIRPSFHWPGSIRPKYSARPVRRRISPPLCVARYLNGRSFQRRFRKRPQPADSAAEILDRCRGNSRIGDRPAAEAGRVGRRRRPVGGTLACLSRRPAGLPDPARSLGDSHADSLPERLPDA